MQYVPDCFAYEVHHFKNKKKNGLIIIILIRFLAPDTDGLKSATSRSMYPQPAVADTSGPTDPHRVSVSIIDS